uniref:Uncharacterized protein n=1 Tax=Hucho hucho TaxID=62062 RepID=A0A4W5R2J8_9TELE
EENSRGGGITDLPADKFPCGLVHQMLQDFLSSRLEAVGYSAPSCDGLVKALSEVVKALVRTVCPDCYRLVCAVALGQLGPEGQQGYGGLVLASRSLWDPYTDTCVAHIYRSQEMFCTAKVFAVIQITLLTLKSGKQGKKLNGQEVKLL